MVQQKYNKLAGKHILVIGGTSGIGFAVAEASIEAGAQVTISSSSSQKIESSIQRLKDSYPDAASIRGFPCDLGGEDVEQNIETLFEKTGKVNHIVFTAGDRLATLPIAEVSLTKIHQAGQVRFVAPLLVAKVGSRYLEKSAESSIVLTTGAVAEHPIPNWSVVAGYAAGLSGLTRNLALDLKPIRVNLVSPGAIDTELWDHYSKEEQEVLKKTMASKTMTGKIGQPEDVAESYLWLMKDSNVTGTVAHSDSGSRYV